MAYIFPILDGHTIDARPGLSKLVFLVVLFLPGKQNRVMLVACFFLF
jgi:hypothetical protein